MESKIRKRGPSVLDKMRQNQETHQTMHTWGYLLTFRFKPSKLAVDQKWRVVQTSIAECDERVRKSILGFNFTEVIVSAVTHHKLKPISLPIKLDTEQWREIGDVRTVVASLGKSLVTQQTAPIGKLIGKAILFDLSQIQLAEEESEFADYDPDKAWAEEIQKMGGIETMMRYYAENDPVFALVFEAMGREGITEEVIEHELMAAHSRGLDSLETAGDSQVEQMMSLEEALACAKTSLGIVRVAGMRERIVAARRGLGDLGLQPTGLVIPIAVWDEIVGSHEFADILDPETKHQNVRIGHVGYLMGLPLWTYMTALQVSPENQRFIMLAENGSFVEIEARC